jgi:hypothetical protein
MIRKSLTALVAAMISLSTLGAAVAALPASAGIPIA